MSATLNPTGTRAAALDYTWAQQYLELEKNRNGTNPEWLISDEARELEDNVLRTRHTLINHLKRLNQDQLNMPLMVNWLTSLGVPEGMINEMRTHG